MFNRVTIREFTIVQPLYRTTMRPISGVVQTRYTSGVVSYLLQIVFLCSLYVFVSYIHIVIHAWHYLKLFRTFETYHGGHNFI